MRGQRESSLSAGPFSRPDIPPLLPAGARGGGGLGTVWTSEREGEGEEVRVLCAAAAVGSPLQGGAARAAFRKLKWGLIG